jgi:hypothetical protein
MYKRVLEGTEAKGMFCTVAPMLVVGLPPVLNDGSNPVPKVPRVRTSLQPKERRLPHALPAPPLKSEAQALLSGWYIFVDVPSVEKYPKDTSPVETKFTPPESTK